MLYASEQLTWIDSIANYFMQQKLRNCLLIIQGMTTSSNSNHNNTHYDFQDLPSSISYILPLSHHILCISCLLFLIRFLYSEMRSFLPSTIQVLFGLGLKYEVHCKMLARASKPHQSHHNATSIHVLSYILDGVTTQCSGLSHLPV